VCKSLKSNETTKHIPVIFLTAFSSARRDLERAESLDVSAYITKPVDPEKLVCLINNIISNLSIVN
jgi:CheY-like chemotaxis protein